MRYIDADGHVEKTPRPSMTSILIRPFARYARACADNELVYWSIDEQLFPRRVGRAVQSGTPTNYEGQPLIHTMGKPESIPCMELSDLKARWLQHQLEWKNDIAVSETLHNVIPR